MATGYRPRGLRARNSPARAPAIPSAGSLPLAGKPVPLSRPSRSLPLADLLWLLGLSVCALLYWKFRIIDSAAAGEFRINLTNVDLFTYIRPSAAGVVRAFANGEFPLWNPYQYAGHPHLAAVTSAALYPLNLPFHFLRVEYAIELAAVLHLVLAGVFSYAFARCIELSRTASGACAVAFMLSGFVLSRAIWFTPAISALPWLPLGLLAIERAARELRARWIVCLAVAVCMPILAGWLQAWTYSVYTLGLYSALRLGQAWRTQQRPPLGLALALLGGVVLGLALAAPQLLPGFGDLFKLN